MTRVAIAMDLGTSGFRAQAIDLSSGEILSTAITTRHPLPGGNVMDHLHFALELGVETATSIMTRAINRVIDGLRVKAERVERLAVCGNTIQLSLFQGIEIRDLAYAGARKQASLGVAAPKREARVASARNFPELALPGRCEVVVPPAVGHEVGADALAMIIKSGMMERDEISLATDFGTNAEVGLFHDGVMRTGSTAAGPALEGQQLTCGMLAAPGAIADLEPVPPLHRLILLDAELLPVRGALVDLGKKGVPDNTDAPRPIGITGTGTVAIVNQAMEAGLVTLPRIATADGMLHLAEDIFLTQDDLKEVGKAIGAVRAGHITLCREAGIAMEDIATVYMSGASGTYVDPVKARNLGMIPPCVKTIRQLGNTSLAMAKDLALDPAMLNGMTARAEELRKSHCMFAASPVFKKVYILEFSYWTEGMPMSEYRRYLRKYALPDLPPVGGTPEIFRSAKRDIDDLGVMGLSTITDIGMVVEAAVEGCRSCLSCINSCPGKALSVGGEPGTIALDLSLCQGVACRRCERVCPVKAFRLNRFFELAKRK